MPARLGVLLVALAAGCDSPAVSPSVPDLGDPYVVRSQPEPVVDGDSLRVTVSYSGGCEEHTFDLGYETTEAGVDLWLTHDANGDLCEAYPTERRAVEVPEAAAQRPAWLYVSEDERVRLSQVRD